MATLNFDAAGVTPDAGFEPIPAGKYLAIIKQSEVKPTKAGTGHYLQLTWEIAEGQYKSRLLFDRLNIHNPNKTAEEIGQRQLSAICHAVGRLQVADSCELHNIPCRIRIVIKQDSGYEPGNEIKGYEPLNGAAVAAPTSTATATPATLPKPAASVPPWMKKTG